MNVDQLIYNLKDRRWDQLKFSYRQVNLQIILQNRIEVEVRPSYLVQGLDVCKRNQLLVTLIDEVHPQQYLVNDHHLYVVFRRTLDVRYLTSIPEIISRGLGTTECVQGRNISDTSFIPDAVS